MSHTHGGCSTGSQRMDCRHHRGPNGAGTPSAFGRGRALDKHVGLIHLEGVTIWPILIGVSLQCSLPWTMSVARSQGALEVKSPQQMLLLRWLALQCRCWTSARRLKHGLQNDGSCALCCQGLETCDHFLVGCSYNRIIWFRTFRCFGFQHLTPIAGDEFGSWWLRLRKRVHKRWRKAFDSLVILVAWLIWLERNDRVFNSSSCTAAAMAAHVCEHVELWCRAMLFDWSQLVRK
jgi:hypothetical protein